MKTLQKITKFPVIVFLSVVYLIFVLYLFPHFDIKTASAGLESLDIRWSYTLNDVTQLFNVLGSDGIKLYKEILIIDSIYALVYGSLLILSLRYLQENMGRLGKLTAWMCWLPIGVVLLDYTENINIWLMLSSFPTLSETIVNFGSTITMLKWYSASVCAGLVICALLAVVLRNTLWKWRNKMIIHH